MQGAGNGCILAHLVMRTFLFLSEHRAAARVRTAGCEDFLQLVWRQGQQVGQGARFPAPQLAQHLLCHVGQLQHRGAGVAPRLGSEQGVRDQP